VKEKRKVAKDGGNSTDMKLMRERYERAVEAESDNRDKALDDLRFVTVPGHQWDANARKARRNRPCYEFPILRSHWRQVVNDQKKARPGIKVRAVKDATAKDAELRQGLIRNIESTSNADWAYDSAFELLVACGFGAWRVTTRYSDDDAWEQDLAVEGIPDALSSVWLDPDSKQPDGSDAMWGFVEETMSEAAFKAKWPKAKVVSFEAAKSQGISTWFARDQVRVAEYWRKVPITKTLCLLSDGRSVDKAEIEPVLDELAAEGVEIVSERVCKTHKVVMSIVSGAEELDGPHDTVFDRIPIITVYANRFLIEGKWQWCGMVRFSRDPQKLLNYNLTTAQEVLAKQHKATPVLTPDMLQGNNVKAMWDKSNVVDVPYLPFTPDPKMPGGMPQYLSPPPVHAAFAQMGQMSIDMLKASDGIFDASVGARSNETSGKAILARQQEGDTATFDYQDALAKSKQSTGACINAALPKVYDTPRVVRVLGKDGAEDYVELYQEVQDRQTGQMVKVNDLSKGKYDVTVTEGGNYDTQRMEFVEMLTQLGQANPVIAQGVPDLIVGALDFPKAEEAAERIKALLPPPIQQMLAQGKEMPPEVMQAMQQAEQMMQQAQQQMQALQQEAMALQEEQAQVGADKADIEARKRELDAQIKVANAELKQAVAEFKAMVAETRAKQAQTSATEGAEHGRSEPHHAD
jgi:hypothetical protein